MTGFWIVAVLLAAGAGTFVAAPLLAARARAGRAEEASPAGQTRRAANVGFFNERLGDIRADDGVLDQSERELLTADLERNLLLETAAEEAASSGEAGPTPWFAVAGLPIVGLIVYALIGASADQELADSLRAAEGRPSLGQLERLEARLAGQPDNHDGRYFLAQAWMAAGEHERASGLLAMMVGTFPQQASLKAQYAEALFLAADRKITPRVKAAIDAGLAANPHATTLYELQGIAAWNEGDAKNAAEHFASALRTTSDPRRRELIMGVLARVTGTELPAQTGAEAHGAQAGAPTVAGTGGEQRPADEGGQGREISVLVELDPSVPVQGSETVFVYARATGGPRMPLAIQRLTPGALPVLVRLTTSMAMVPNMSLDTFDTVEVVARLSRSGSVTPGEGDVEALSPVLDLTQPVDVVKLRLTDDS